MRQIFSLVGRIKTEGLDTLEKGLKDVDKKLTKTANKIDRFGRNVSKLGVGISKITAPFAAVGVGVFALATKAGQAADRLLDLTEVTGLSTDSLQEMKVVAADAGVDFEGFIGTISKLSNQMPEIIKGTGPAAEAIEALGISVLDSSGNIRDMNVLFPEVLDKLRDVENTTERNAAAQDLFGRSLDNIAPILGMTTKQFEAARQEAHELGVVLGEDALLQANEFRKSLDKLKVQAGAVGLQLGSSFVPILQDTLLPLIKDRIVPAILNFVDKIKSLITWFNNLSPGMKDLITDVGLFAVTFGPMLIAIGKTIGMVKILTTTFHLLRVAMLANPIGIIITAIVALIAVGVLLYRNWDTVKVQFLKVWDSIVYGVEQAVSYMKSLLIDFVKIWIDSINIVGQYIPGLNKALDSASAALSRMAEKEKNARYERKLLKDETKALSMMNSDQAKAIEIAKEATEKQTESIKKQTKATKEQIKAAKEQAKAAEKLAEDKAKFEENWTGKLRQEANTRKELLSYEYEQAITEAERLGADKLAIEEYYKVKREQLATEEAQATIEKETEKRRTIAQMGLDAFNQFVALGQMQTDNKIAHIDQQLAAEKIAIEHSTMSEEDKAAAIEAIDEAADEKKKVLMIKQAKRDKAAAIFAAIISTGVAIAKTFANLGAPVGIVLGAIVGVLGAIQVAMIAAKPLPQLAKGGVVKRQKGGIDVTVGEGMEDEAILPMKTGLKTIVDGVVSGVKNIFAQIPELPGSFGSSSALAVGAAGGGGGAVNLNVGVLVADDAGLMNLERTLYKFRIEELLRKGE